MTHDIPGGHDPATRPTIPEECLFLCADFPGEGREARGDPGGTAQVWLGNHRHFRAALRWLGTRLEAFDPFSAEARDAAAALHRSVLALLGGLEGHHAVEDTSYFPRFRAMEPRLARGFDLLDGDHLYIHAAMDRIAATSAEAAALFGNSATLADPRRGHLRDEWRAALRGFETSLLRHLDHEEDLVIPLLIAHHTGRRAA